MRFTDSGVTVNGTVINKNTPPGKVLDANGNVVALVSADRQVTIFGGTDANGKPIVIAKGKPPGKVPVFDANGNLITKVRPSQMPFSSSSDYRDIPW
jgi:hypothetical protein